MGDTLTLTPDRKIIFQPFRGDVLSPLCRFDAKKPHAEIRRGAFFGGPGGIRTLDLCDANAALSQLSYGPIYLTTLNILTLSNGFVKVFLSVPCCGKSQAFIAHKFSPFILSNFNMTIWPPSIPLVGSLRFPLLCSSCPLQFPPFSHVSHTAYADSPISRKQARKATSLLIYPSIFRG